MFWLITIYGYNIGDDKKRREKKKTYWRKAFTFY